MRFFTIFFLLAFIAEVSKGQLNPPSTPIYEQTITPPSPAVAALDRYIDFPVSYSTGVPDISIPIYTLKSSKLSVPISFSYHGGGIKVSDRSQSLGLGWSLNAGGSISRVVQDIPDDANNGAFTGYLNMIYPDETKFDGYYKDICLGNEIYNVYVDSATKHDGQPDQFFYNFNGQGGKFIFRNLKAAGVNPQAVTIPYKPIKINWVGGYACFQIIDEQGNIYQFGDPNQYGYSASATDWFTPFNPGANIYTGYTTTAWHLRKIISADKTDSIMFSYTAIAGGGYVNEPYTYLMTVLGGINGAPSQNSGLGILSVSGSSSEQQAMGIQRIDCANGKVVFTYDSAGKLTGINIYNNSNNTISEIKSFNVFQSFFNSINEPSNTSGLLRPRLDSIKESGYINNVVSVTNPPYKFSYVSPDVPDMFSKSQDYWGYFNSRNNTNMISLDQATDAAISPDFLKRAVDTSASKKGMLQSITYPTGGYTNFTFEPNQIYTSIPSSNYIPRSVNNHISTLQLQPNSGISQAITISPSIQGQVKLDFTGESQCTPISNSNCVANNPEVILKDITQNTVIADITLTSLLQPTNFQPIQTTAESVTYYALNPSDQYLLFFPTPGSITALGPQTQFRLNAVLTQTLPDSLKTTFDSTIFYAGGLRIKQIQHNDGAGSTITKNYNYTIPYWNSGLFQGDYSVIANWFFRPKYYLAYYTTGSSVPPAEYISSMVYSEGFNVPIGSTNGSSVSYQQVEESTTANGIPLGKNVYTYNTAKDYISPQFPLFRFDMEYDRSQLLDTKTYSTKASGGYTLIKDVANTYNNINDYAPSEIGTDSIKYYLAYSDWDWQHTQVAFDNGQRLINADENQVIDGIQLVGYQAGMPVPGCPIYNFLFNHVAPFYYHVVKQLLMSTVTSTFDMNGANPVASETYYNYGNLAHIQPTRITTINSDGRVKIDSMKYPLDYSYQAGSSPKSIINNFNQQLSLLQTQRGNCYQVAGNLNIGNLAQYMYMINTCTECENNYNKAAAALVTQYNANLAQYQSSYLNTESSLSPTNKVIAFMQDRNMVTPKISTATTVNSYPTLRDSTNYELADAAQNIIRPQQVNIQVSNNPIEARAQFYAYDQAGNLAEQSKTGGPHTSYQWGYNKTYPVAQVENTASNDIFYDGFEEGDGKSTVNDSKTGHYSYTGIYANKLSGLDNGSYVLSYWQKSGTSWSLITAPATVSNGTYAITLGTSSAPVQIDDIRFYPQGALMTTYTYDPLIGMTSTTAPNGKIIYYEYDGLQRLLNIKDQYGNITKSFIYNYAGETNSNHNNQ